MSVRIKAYRNTTRDQRWATGTLRHRGITVRMAWAGPIYLQLWTGKARR